MISVPTPFPGSSLHTRLLEEGRILTTNWGSYSLWNVVVQPKNMSVDDLKEGFRYALTQIYSKESSEKRMNYFKNIYLTLRREKR